MAMIEVPNGLNTPEESVYPEVIEQQNILEHFIETGKFVYYAKGSLPGFEEFNSLYENEPDVLLYHPGQLVELFRDDDEAEVVFKSWVLDEIEKDKRKTDRMIDEMEVAAIPRQLLMDVKMKLSGQKGASDEYFLTGEQAPVDVKLSRYVKYRFARDFLQSRGIMPTQKRLVEIALGFNPDTRKAGPSFSGKIAKLSGEVPGTRKYNVSVNEVRDAAAATDCYHLLYPKEYKSFLLRIGRAVKTAQSTVKPLKKKAKRIPRDYIQEGVDFFIINGRLPTKPDYYTEEMPSITTINKYYVTAEIYRSEVLMRIKTYAKQIGPLATKLAAKNY